MRRSLIVGCEMRSEMGARHNKNARSTISDKAFSSIGLSSALVCRFQFKPTTDTTLRSCVFVCTIRFHQSAIPCLIAARFFQWQLHIAFPAARKMKKGTRRLFEAHFAEVQLATTECALESKPFFVNLLHTRFQT